MASYRIEIVSAKGNTVWPGTTSPDWPGYRTLKSARIKAIEQIKRRGKESTYVNILKDEGYGRWPIVERIDYSEYVSDWTCRQYGKQGNAPESRMRTYRVSAQTGRLLDYDKYWKYL